MKFLKFIITYFICVLCLTGCKVTEEIIEEVIIKFSNPVGVTYFDQTGLYYVSNRGSGEIITLDANQDKKLFSNLKLNKPNGITILKGILYVANSSTSDIKGFDLSTKDEVFSLTLPGQYLNGITSDDNNILFVSDTHGNSIYRINIDDNSFTTFSHQSMLKPTGIVYSKQNNILLCCVGDKNEKIVKVNGTTGALIETVTLPYIELDGIALDKNNNIYFSCWSLGKVFKIDFNFNLDPIEVSSGHSGTAGIYINNSEKKLVVANYASNKVDFVDIEIESVSTGVVRDYNGNRYKTIKIGDQWWMAENFRGLHNRDESEIKDVYIYNNNNDNIAENGRLYSLESAINAAPEGWHLPTDADWQQLEVSLGMSEAEAGNSGWRGSDQADKLVLNSGLNVKYSGYYRYSEKIFKGMGEHASFWISSRWRIDINQAWGREMFKNNSKVSRQTHPKDFAFSVRYVKD